MKSSRLPNHLLAQGDLYTTEDGEVTHFQIFAGLGFGLFFFWIVQQIRTVIR